ncbi:hypothetical protein FOG18_08980 [Legionella israelensis]|uniref:hypothetical protein n=1 Tax=Legionella israelensis TaxID=454 RepID=UPI00117FFDD9|nr:hypothetical protein [Legionella israelensis]QDP72678.1 hypothetical protein FOG18_08980 [Legionella israelensis]
MKTIALNLSFLLLMLLSFTTFAADKIVITGEPVVLEQRGDVYVPPSGYSVTTDYHYVTLDGTNRVCYAEAQPSLASLNVVNVNVEVGGSTVVWHCYEYNTQYFTVNP